MEFIPSDVDADQTHTFTVALQPKRFDIITIGQQKGQVRTKAGAHLDFESFDSFSLSFTLQTKFYFKTLT